MKFSIVTPNYNYGRFLQKSLESVLTQSNASGAPTIEHIVIDGGSTDDSLAILKEWASFAAAQPAAKDGRYTFFYVSEPDEGQTDAINKGFRRATGDIVAWLNADEWYLPGKLARVASAFVQHPKTDFLYGEPLFVKADGSPIRVKRDHPFSRFVLLYYGCYIASCCSFWRRRILDDGHYLDKSYKAVMDGEYWARICKLGYRFQFLPMTIAAFTWHDSNVSLAYGTKRRTEGMSIRRRYGRFPPCFDTFFRRLAHGWRRILVVFRLCFLPKENCV